MPVEEQMQAKILNIGDIVVVSPQQEPGLSFISEITVVYPRDRKVGVRGRFLGETWTQRAADVRHANEDERSMYEGQATPCTGGWPDEGNVIDIS